MPRLRSVAVVALLWVAAFAGSSAPDGFGGPRHAEMPLVVGLLAPGSSAAEAPDAPRAGKRWAVLDADGKRWDLFDEERGGKRWT